MQTYVADCFDKRLVCADFSFLQWWDTGSNPGDKSKLLPPAHLIPSLKAEIRVHSLIICTKQHAYTHEYKTFTFNKSWRWIWGPLTHLHTGPRTLGTRRRFHRGVSICLRNWKRPYKQAMDKSINPQRISFQAWQFEASECKLCQTEANIDTAKPALCSPICVTLIASHVFVRFTNVITNTINKRFSHLAGSSHLSWTLHCTRTRKGTRCDRRARRRKDHVINRQFPVQCSAQWPANIQMITVIHHVLQICLYSNQAIVLSAPIILCHSTLFFGSSALSICFASSSTLQTVILTESWWPAKRKTVR